MIPSRDHASSSHVTGERIIMPQSSATPTYQTFADVYQRVGDVAPERIYLRPQPGKATEADLLRLHRRTDKLYELVDGILVEKVMGYLEGGLAADIIRLLGRFLDDHDLGDLAGADATMRLMPRLV